MFYFTSLLSPPQEGDMTCFCLYVWPG